jgi:mRNA interferase RelE/StbE
MSGDGASLSKWQIVFSSRADKAGKKLDRAVRTRIGDFLEDRVAKSSNPRELGSALSGEWAGHWRYRLGDYRIICKIEDEIVTVLVIEIGHRREIYR